MKMFSKENPRVVDLVRQRELSESCAASLSRKLQVTDDLVARLGLEKELEGHGGCVNCLEWNESGEILASASDDTHVILWDPFRYTKKKVFRTGHSGNIFSVKFMPKSNDGILVTGAGDCCIRVHDITVSDTILVCSCHKGRVKRIATAPSVPFMFWTAGEDGLILQYDTRVPHSCTSQDRRAVLINLVNHLGRLAEAKCITINARRPELIAIGANDAYVRMYDRRMIKPSTCQATPASNVDAVNENSEGIDAQAHLQRAGKGDSDDNIPLGCARYFVAGHLRTRHQDQKRNRSLAATYLTFSADGNDLLVNMGGEQIYLFDVNKGSSSKFLPKWTNGTRYSVPGDQWCSDQKRDEGIQLETYFKHNDPLVLPIHIENIKEEANTAFQKQKYTTAINLYNKAIAWCPHGAVLYANRAASFMKRAWDGDIYAALQDCQTTILLDPRHVKAHFRLARCLYELNRAPEAHKVIKNFQQNFPEFATNSACRALYKDIKKALGSEETNEEETDEVEEEEDKDEVEFPVGQVAQGVSAHELYWQRNSVDYDIRFCGHCNTTTDIKEANFFGSDGQYIVAGSDDGSFFIWDRETTNILRVLRGDESIVNCLQPHPSSCLLATSGIDPVIRLWSPRPEDGSQNERAIENLEDVASANQLRMKSNTFELMLLNMGYRFPGQQDHNQDQSGDDGDERERPMSPSQTSQSLNCRQS
ncbi:WD and tetratricopeptide repeats protein 1-like [Neodiprion fabricii]|uniref:WD and tetratricopeptide repeats protein 1-like n=1 Tax=Neodiprion fabricii TaxID=2872261 RepID=UPI001ED944B6|nr:WD and tetratricopeptide repeats protein 1-like [Neodiprion fabricii]XP_046426358.1 WD and tetratricopeptide repeats protein 1-like [Neodiprion fabricii]